MTHLLSHAEQGSSGCHARRSRLDVGVAQILGGLTEAFLSVGSKKPRAVTRPPRALLMLGAASPLSNRHSERGPGFRIQLCATATETLALSRREQQSERGRPGPSSRVLDASGRGPR
jgi:hypothetical protein